MTIISCYVFVTASEFYYGFTLGWCGQLGLRRTCNNLEFSIMVNGCFDLWQTQGHVGVESMSAQGNEVPCTKITWVGEDEMSK